MSVSVIHLKVPDQTSRFWAEVRRAMRDYQQHRRTLMEQRGKLREASLREAISSPVGFARPLAHSNSSPSRLLLSH